MNNLNFAATEIKNINKYNGGIDLQSKVPKSFYTIIEDYNKKFVDNQLLYINKTLNLIYHKLSLLDLIL